MTHHARHAALIALRVTDHLLDLRPLLFALGNIGLAPLFLAATGIVAELQDRAAMNPKLLERFLEKVRI
jgi:hypothetical protein